MAAGFSRNPSLDMSHSVEFVKNTRQILNVFEDPSGHSKSRVGKLENALRRVQLKTFI